MSVRRQLFKEIDFTSEDNDRKANFFHTNRRVLLLLIAAIILSLISWRTWQSYKHIRTTEIQMAQINSLEKSALSHDKMLTMSAIMAAVTKEHDWEIRYRGFDSRSKAVVKEIRRVFNVNTVDAKDAEEGLRIFVDDKLDMMESKALELIDQRKYNDAAALIQSPEYEEQKQAYDRGMKEFVNNAYIVLKDRRDNLHLKALGGITAVIIILLIITLAWLVLYKKRNYQHSKKSKAQQEFDAFAQEWHKTFNAITDGVCIIDKEEGKILQCNSAMTRFLKRPYNDIIGRSCCELLHNSSEPVNRCPLTRMYESHRSETKDFEIGDKWLNIKVDPLIDNDENLVGAVHIISDITEQRKASRALQDSENKFRLAFANAQDAIVWIDVGSGVITNCNKAAEELFERGKKEIIGQHHTTLYPEDNAEYYHSLLVQSGKEPNSNIEAEILTISGDKRTVTIAVSTMEVDRKEIVQGIIRDITDSKRAIEEIKNLAKFPSEDPNPVLRISENCEILYANDAGSPLLKAWQIKEDNLLPEPWCKRIKETYESGNSATYELDCEDNLTFFITLEPIVGSGYVNAYGLDITKLKKAENEKMELELQLSQKQKMEAVGTLAGGIAHDFNNILGAMQGYLELSLDDLSEDNIVRDHLEQIMSCVSRATKLVKQILTFSRKDQEKQEKEPLQISSIVKEVLGMLRSSLPATIKISRKIKADASMILADSTQIHQVLVNLCTNASHAMGKNGGLLEVSLENVVFESETRVGDEYLKPGQYVKLSVSDSGHGIEKEVLDRIFEPFFTTKKANEGTGLGLSVVHGIIKSHDGAITVSSTRGEGTTFEIFLPEIKSGEVPENQSAPPDTKDKELILLVDDEELIINSTRQILERLGFDVVAKVSSIDALETFQEEPEKFDLVITDQVMPNMTGTQLAEKIISIRPDIPVILCSVFPEDVCPEEVKRIGIKEFMAKPISMQKINKVIRKVLDKSSVPA
ncbi:MAG: PAS domain-containing protein [Sedimentisphaerales bacterium]|nr:PAS domain-containing protein [Sedimentisphaerales bacterium]